jgi:hypothetical protein
VAARFSKLSFEIADHLRNPLLITAIPSPCALLFDFHQTGFFQNSHVMRDSGLRKFHTLFDVSRAEVFFFVFFFQRLQNSTARGIGDGMEERAEIRRGHG